jgi:predicted Zn-dependent protease
MRRELRGPDKIQLDAAQGWLGLGNYTEANEELEKITPTKRAHPDVLRVRYEVYAAAEKWEGAAEIAKAISELAPESPFGFVHLARALHALKRTREARDVLLPVVDQFNKEQILFYNLACYCCQLGDRKTAWQCLERAIALAGPSDIRLRALDDPDLAPMWLDIAEI